MKRFMTATAALALISVPAQAQLLGSGPLTGGLGSVLDINSTISRPTDTLRTVTRGTVEGSAATDGSHSVDRNSGRVEARRNADITGGATIDQLVATPIAPVGAPAGASASGNGSASGSGNAQAQLIGTDAVGSIAGAAVGRAHGTIGTAQAASASLVGQVHGAAGTLPGSAPAVPGMVGGSASGDGSAEGEGSASLMSAPLAVAGSVAGAANGATSISPGMPVVTPAGLPVGEVREIVANSRGEVEQVLVSNGDFEQMVPAANLGAGGSALVMGQGNAEVGTASPEEEEQP